MCVDLFDIKPQTNIDYNNQRKDQKDIQKLAEKFIEDRSDRSFSRLMKRCDWGLRTFIKAFTKNDYDTDSIISLTMEHVWLNIGTFDPSKGKFSTWIYSIAYHDMIAYYKENGFNDKLNIVSVDVSDLYEDVSDDDEIVSSFSGPSETMFDNMWFDGKDLVSCTKRSIQMEIYDASVKCMEFLPDHVGTVMKERFLNGKKMPQIADDMGTSVFNVQNWVTKGKKCLTEEVGKRFEFLRDIYFETIN